MAEDSLPCSKNIVEVPNEEFLEIRGSTHNLLAKLRYTWTIDNFNFSVYRNSEEFLSPIFSVGINNKSEWRLKLIPNHGSTINTALYCCLGLIACNQTEIHTGYKIHILNDNGEKVNTFSRSGSQLFKKEQYITVLDEQADKKNELVFHDQLTISCEIIYKIGSEDNILEKLPILPSTQEMDFTFLLENKQLSDVTLCAGGREFPAHKVILSARSAVFRTMFQCDMEEAKKNRVKITDINEKGLGEMLRYMYTGKINELEKMAPYLVGIAEKYNIEDLKMRCAETLMKSLSLENVVELFILSDTFRITNLNIQVKKFIKDHAAVIVIRPEFQTMVRTHQHLGIEACCLIGCKEPIS